MDKIISALLVSLLVADLAAAMSTAPEKKGQPDLVVTEVVAKQPPSKGKNKVKIKYTIKNQGDAASAATSSSVRVQGESVKSFEQKTPSLKPGQSYTTTLDYDLAKVGNYQVKVSADYINKIPESNERNNENSVRFSISRTL